MRKIDSYTRKYGEDFGRKLYHALQSQAAHAGVSARLRRKIDALTGRKVAAPRPQPGLPLFAEDRPSDDGEAGTSAEPAAYSGSIGS